MEVTQYKRVRVSGETTGMDAVAASYDKVSAAQKRASDTGNALSKTQDTQEKSVLRVAKQMDFLARSIDPVVAALDKLQRMERLVDVARSQGQEIKESWVQALERARQRYEALSKAANDNARGLDAHAKATGLNTMQMMEGMHVLRSFTDSVVAGQSPMRALAMEGSRIGQIFASGQGGVGGTFSALRDTLAGIVTPARAAALGVAGVALAGIAAWDAWDEKIKGLQRSLNGIGGASGLTVSGAQRLALNGGNGLTVGQSFESLGGYIRAGIDGGTAASLLGSQKQFGRAFGLSAGDAGAALAGAFGDPSKGLGELQKYFGQLGYETELQVRRLQATGRLEEARATLFKAFEGELKKTTDTTGALAKAMDLAAAAASKTWAYIGQIGADRTPAEQLSAAGDRLGRALGTARRGSFQEGFRRGAVGGYIGETSIQSNSVASAAGNYFDALAGVGKEIFDAGRAKADELAKRFSYLNAQIQAVNDDARIGAQAIMARSVAEKLAAEQERIRVEAARDANKALTATAEAEKARTLALAESQKVLRDTARELHDQGRTIGVTDFERARIENDIFRRNLNERTLPGTTAAPAASGALNLTGLPSDVASNARANSGVAAYIWQAALARGIDPSIALRVINQESSFNIGASNLTSREQSYGLMQLNTMGGLGASALRQGINVRDPSTWRQQVDFGLDVAARDGWRQWYGARDVGISRWQGIGGPRSGGGAPQAGEAPGGGTADQLAGRDFENRVKSLWVPALNEAERALDGQKRALDIQISSFGLSTGEIAKNAKAIELENMLRSRGLEISDAMREKINALATAEGELASMRERADRAQRKAIETSDLIRGTFSDLISGPLTALAHGQNPGKAARDTLARFGDNLISSGARSLTEGIFGPFGKSLFGAKTTTAMMNVDAAMVNIGGAGGILGGLGGGAAGGSGGGGLFGFFGRLFGGGGGAGAPMQLPGGLPQFADGTDFASGGPAIVGERGIEIVNLPRGAQVIPNHALGGSTIHIGGPTLTVMGSVNDDNMPRVEAMIAAASKRTVAAVQRQFGKMGQVYNARHG